MLVYRICKILIYYISGESITLVYKLVTLRSTIGIVEYWNDGIMGFGKMGNWFVGKIILTRHEINGKIPSKSSRQR